MVNPLAKFATAPVMLVVPTMSATATPVMGLAASAVRTSMRMKITLTIRSEALLLPSLYGSRFIEEARRSKGPIKGRSSVFASI